MTIGSLFSGIGGFDLGFERAGMTVKWQVEIDDRCRSFLHHHWPHIPQHGDIRDVGAHNLEPVDLICGGVPCQPASRAGKQRGSEDNRWLWPEALRIVEELKPTWAVFENPPGIGDVGLAGILSELESLGYERRVFGIPACAVGSPQIRERYFIVAHSESVKRYELGDMRRAQCFKQDCEDGGSWKPEREVGGVNQGHLADATGARQDRPEREEQHIQRPSPLPARFSDCRSDMENAECGERQAGRITYSGAGRSQCESTGSNGWAQYVWLPCADGKVRRAPDDSFSLVDGIHRSLLAALGNSLVPQVTEVIGRAIVEASC